jgi:hypothetical protein
MPHPIGFPELATIAVLLALIVVPIWFSVRARPLGSLPYRWGFYTSWQMFVSAIVCVLINGPGADLLVALPIALLFLGAAAGLFYEEDTVLCSCSSASCCLSLLATS